MFSRPVSTVYWNSLPPYQVDDVTHHIRLLSYIVQGTHIVEPQIHVHNVENK